ncbi:serine O-acetyltransferase EpsC [Zavarzinella formosa]|uniref:serine O-acetyltransferase EpsC n=1 Tax=Zavarzinella formosa TaxID=360055 RepID=UPI0005938906|nr:serine O-acetyltransferase EpsC [Zavarzinella formosa]
MAADLRIKEGLPEITEALVASYTECSRINHLGHEALPSRDGVVDIVSDLYEVIYPGFGRRQKLHIGNVEYYIGSLIDSLHDKLTTQIARALRHDMCRESPHVDYEALAQAKTVEFLKRLPQVRDTLDQDVAAAYRGDPAARSHHEIIFCYPGLEAITIFRLAHVLLELGVPYIPRMMTESAHSKTGIDIHPGATIGHGFFIDHGTGVVIGETCNIGNNVKIYQGVTLGALSFQKDDDGELVRGTKRHPTLEDDVIVYANATILGGRTVVGTRSVIGSSVWLTYSVPPETVVVLDKPSLKVKSPNRSPDGFMYFI